MISYIQGEIINSSVSDRFDTVEVLTSQGIGYEVVVPKNTHIDGAKDTVLYTSHIIREDSQTLYGFVNREDKKLFNLLITVSGVGPKSAISIMSKFSISQLSKLIATEDFKTISTVPGLGKKSAQKIIVELKGNLGWVQSDGKEVDDNSEVLKELKEALKSLGFDSNQIKDSIVNAQKSLEKEKYSVEELIKFALSGK